MAIFCLIFCALPFFGFGQSCSFNIPIFDADCLNNNTPNDDTDDIIGLSVLINGTDLGSGYSITSSIGAFTPSQGTYGNTIDFTLPPGSANNSGGTFSVTVRDLDDPNCSIMFEVNNPGVCSANGPCSITSADAGAPFCTDNQTPLDNTDDILNFTINPTGTGLGSTFSLQNLDPTFPPVPGGSSYGAPTDVQLGLGSAGNGPFTLRIIDNNNPACTFDFVVPNVGPCSAPPACNITDAGLADVQCDDNGTPNDLTDDNIVFTLDPQVTNGGTGYSISISPAASVAPASGTYGTPTQFTIVGGAASGLDYSVTLADDASPLACTLLAEVTNPGTCSAPPPCDLSDAGLDSVLCNVGNPRVIGDEFISFDLNPTGSNVTQFYNVFVDNGTTITPMQGTYGAATNFSLGAGSGGSGLTYTITIQDVAFGNDCEIQVQVADPCGNCPPVTFDVEAQNIDQECGEPGNVLFDDWVDANGFAVVSPGSGSVTWTSQVGFTSEGCSNNFSAVVQFTATNDCGNFATTTANFAETDTEGPVFDQLPDNLTLECSPATQGQIINDYIANDGNAMASDACGPIVSLVTALTGDTAIGCTQYFFFTVTATDNCGLTATATGSLAFEDTTPPDFVGTPPNMTVECDGNGNRLDLVAVLDYINLSATDHCQDAILDAEVISTTPGCGRTFTKIIQYTASDGCGNTATTTGSLTVEDTTPPTLTPPADLTVECDGNGNPGDLADFLGNAAASDLCSGATVTSMLQSNTPGCGNTFVNIYKFTATDSCGNTATATASFTVRDTRPPFFTNIPANLTVECDGNGNPSDLANFLNSATADDQCGNATVVPVLQSNTPGCGGTFVHVYRFTATDDCGNSSTSSSTVSFTVRDTRPPFFTTPPQNLTVECDGAGNLASLNNWLNNFGFSMADDVCSNVILSKSSIFQPACGGTGVHRATFTATDACGNSATATATFSIQDTQAPFFTTPPQNVTVECDGAGNLAQLNNWLNNFAFSAADDLCGNATPSAGPGSFSPGPAATGVHAYIFIITDDCGNTASGQATFTIEDTTPPFFVEPPQSVVEECDPLNGNLASLAHWLATYAGAVADDICGGTIIQVASVFAPGCGTTGVHTATFTPIDESGNVGAPLTATFTIIDTRGPIFKGPFDKIVECDRSTQDADFQNWLDDIGGADLLECSTFSVNYMILNEIWGCGNTVERSVRFTATDACGNTSTASAKFSVQDTRPPVFTKLPEDITLECSNADLVEALAYDWVVSNGYAQAEDACGKIIWKDCEVILREDCAYFGATLYRFVAVDECDNMAFADASIRVVDNTPPDITFCPPGKDSFTCKSALPVPTPGAVLATDACSEVAKTYKGSYENGGTGCPDWPLVVTYVYSVKDRCGNEATCEQPFKIVFEQPDSLDYSDTVAVSCLADIPVPPLAAQVLGNKITACGFPAKVSVEADSGPILGADTSRTYTFLVQFKQKCGFHDIRVTRTYTTTGNCRPDNTLLPGSKPFDDWDETPTALATLRGDIFLFPNPATESTTLAFHAEDAAELRVFLSTGNGALWERQWPVAPGLNRLEIALRDLPPGLYSVSVQTPHGLRSLRLSKIDF